MTTANKITSPTAPAKNETVTQNKTATPKVATKKVTRALGCAERVVAISLATSNGSMSTSSLVTATGLTRGQVRGASRSMARKNAVTRNEDQDTQKLTKTGERMLQEVTENAELPLRLRRKIATQTAA